MDLSPSEDRTVRGLLHPDVLALYESKQLNPHDALWISGLPEELQPPAAARCMRNFNITSGPWVPKTKTEIKTKRYK